MTTQEYILSHREDNVQQLALSLHGRPTEEVRHILQQIEGWQRLRTKVPTWAAVEELIYPVRLSLEQCSSEATACYKAEVAGQGCLLVDLTGGLGVDFSFMARGYERAVYVERNADLCQLARHNLPLLSLPEAEVVEGDGVEYLQHMTERASLIFLDPFRRDDAGRKTVRIEDCTPNVLELLPLLLQRSERILVKLSPMLDITQALRSLRAEADRSRCAEVVELSITVHIVGAKGEVKEILLDITPSPASASTISSPTSSSGPTTIICHDEDTHIVFSPSDTHPAEVSFPADSQPAEVFLSLRRGELPPLGAEGGLCLFLYEPSPVLMKAGCFRLLAQRYGVRPLHANSHLYVSEELRQDFPGRRFRVLAISGLGKREQRDFLAAAALRQGSKRVRANLAVRNFPLSVDELRRRLKLAEGGSEYWFATTTEGEKHILLACEKA